MREQTILERWRQVHDLLKRGATKEQGYTGSLNLLNPYITQGRAEGNQPVITRDASPASCSPGPHNLRDKDSELLDGTHRRPALR